MGFGLLGFFSARNGKSLKSSRYNCGGLTQKSVWSDLGKQLGIGSRGMHMHSFSITKRFSYVQTLSIATVTYVEAGPFHFRSISNKHR